MGTYEDFGPSIFNFPITYSSIEAYSFEKDEIVWIYHAPKTSMSFYASYWGFSEVLPNGNILVTHITNGGSAFELTKDKEIIWEWVNPNKIKNGLPARIYRLHKVPRKLVDPFLESSL